MWCDNHRQSIADKLRQLLKFFDELSWIHSYFQPNFNTSNMFECDGSMSDMNLFHFRQSSLSLSHQVFKKKHRRLAPKSSVIWLQLISQQFLFRSKLHQVSLQYIEFLLKGCGHFLVFKRSFQSKIITIICFADLYELSLVFLLQFVQ